MHENVWAGLPGLSGRERQRLLRPAALKCIHPVGGVQEGDVEGANSNELFPDPPMGACEEMSACGFLWRRRISGAGLQIV